MSEPEPTGYRESPDTTDGPVSEDQVEDRADDQVDDQGDDGGSATLTTDDHAQRDDGVVRPGNQPD